MKNYQTFRLSNFELQCGAVLPQFFLAYKTYGELNRARDNVVVLPTFYTGSHHRNRGFFGGGRAIDPARHFIVSINLAGNGFSSSPSNTPAPFDGPRFPDITLYDNIKAQSELLHQQFGIDEIALVSGWSMAACQAFQWAAQFPDRVAAIVPFCGSAKTSIHNQVFLEGVKAALTADQTFAQGDYKKPPKAGLQAFARVYAGWAFSQTFYRDECFKQLGFESAEALLVDWEKSHLDWDANNLLCKLKTWQLGDISANSLYQGDYVKALSAIRARSIIICCDHDLYFRPEDSAIESRHIADADLRVFKSPWGHCVASPGNEPRFQQFLDQAISEVLR